MEFDDLTDNNIEMYMMKMHDNPQCIDMEEYNRDIKRIKYIKRLLNRYDTTGELKERLILNHIIVLYNVFGPAATRILYFKIDESSWSVLKTFLVFLGYQPPDRIEGIDGRTIRDTDISINFDVANRLREI